MSKDEIDKGKVGPSPKGPDDADTSTEEDITKGENNFSVREGYNNLTENQKLILRREAHEDDYSDRDLFDEKGKPDLALVTDIVKKKETFITFRDNEEIRYYKDGIYVKNGETRIKEICHQIMEGGESRQAVNEIIGKIQRSTYVDRDMFFEESTRHLIVLENGLLDLDNLELKEHDPEY